MIPTFQVNSKAFGEQLDALVKTTGKSAQQALRSEGKLFVADLVRATPPFGAVGGANESFASQRKVGQQAVERDIRRMYAEVDLDRVKNEAIRERLRKLVKRGDTDAVEKILRNLKIPLNGVLREPDPDLHRSFQDNRGHVKKAYFWVLSGPKLRKFIREEQEDVGKAKGGWARAAAALGLKLPNWITRHASPGGFEDHTNDATKPRLRIWNAVAYIQATGDRLRVVDYALQRRVASLKAKLERILASGWKKK